MPELIEKLMKDGYTEEAEILKKYYRNAILLHYNLPTGEIPIGASKCGNPDLPPDIEVPDMPLVMQINLYELAESGADVENLLPKTGMLYIFWNFEFEECDYNFIHWDGDMSTLKRTETSEKYTAEVIITFEAHEEYDESSVYYEKLNELVSDYDYDPDALAENRDKLLGYPTGGNEPDFKKEDLLLLQYKYHEGCVWTEYWIMKKEDLKTIDFSKVLIDFDTD